MQASGASSIIFNGNRNIITTNGELAYGLFTSSAGANIVVNDAVQINTGGKSSIAVYAQSGTNIDLGRGSQIATGIGSNAYGLYANGTNGTATIAATDLSVESNGVASHGVYAANGGGKITLFGQNNKITTHGEKVYGIIASRSGSSVVIDGKVDVVTTGEKSNGVVATNATDTDLSYINLGINSSVSTKSINSYGLVSNHANSLIDAQNITVSTIGDDSIGIFADDLAVVNLVGKNNISTSGLSAHGIQATNSSIINAANTQIETSGLGANAINSGTKATVNIEQQNSNLYSINGSSFNSLGGTINALLNSSSVLNNGILINADTDASSTDFGIVNLTASNMTLVGDIQAGTGSSANVTLANTLWSGAARNGGQINLDNMSVWNLSVSSDVLGIGNAGTINFANSIPGNMLTVHGNYIGNNGNLVLNTSLGGDDSVTDKLLVEGNTSGTTNVRVNNIGGIGQKTLNGIELVQVKGLSDGEFVQSSRIVAGAYDYSLNRGDGANAANWYLTSTLSPTSETASIRPEAGSYMANMAAANKLFNLRLEDREGRAENSSMWLRQQGDRTKFRDTSGQLKTSTNTYVIQGGGEVAQIQFTDRDRLGIGLMLGYGKSDSETGNSRTGYNSKGTVDGYSGGVYATWYQDAKTLNGAYVDSWVQYSLLNGEVNGEQLSSESYDMNGLSASVESGYRIPVYQGENGNVFVTPQAQIIWSGIKADDHHEVNGTRVTSDGKNNVQTRLGVKLSRDGVSDMDKGSDKLFTTYVETNWLHNTEQAGAVMNGVSVKQAGNTNVGELKVGVEGQLNKHVNLWTNVAQQIGDKGYSDTALTVGFKYRF